METGRYPANFKHSLETITAALSWVWSVFFSLLVIGTFLAIMYFTGARETWLWLNAKTWEQTQCEINQVYSGRKESTKAGSTSVKISFKVSASYTYHNEFQSFTGSRYDFRGIFTSSYQSVKDDLHYLRSNSIVPCYFNPRKPEQSVINRGFQLDFLIMLIPLFPLGMFAYMALSSLLSKLGFNRLFQKKPKRFLS